ncbi:MAG TPA: nuclear transport factor 2 family protein [Allosphingosinicella sp.]|jgi:uncharacterized protein (TIGR02246 family)
MALAKMALPILLALAASAAAAAPPAPADRAALERLAADNDAAWTARDWATITGQYADQGSLRVGPGEPIHAGRAAISRFFKAAFGRRGAGFRHVTRIDRIEMVTGDVAIADGHVRVERAAEGGGWSLAREFTSSSLLVRDGGRWKLHSVRATPLPGAARSG